MRPVPAKTHRAHKKPPALGDRSVFAVWARKHGFGFLDWNVIAVWDPRLKKWVIYLGHWLFPWKDGYRYTAVLDHNGKILKRRGREVRVPWHGEHITTNQMNSLQYSLLRMTLKPGLSWRSRKKPELMQAGLAVAKRQKVVPTLELKALSEGPDPFLRPDCAKDFRAQVDHVGWEPIVMTIGHLGDGPGRLRNFHEHGNFATAGIQWGRPLSTAERAYVGARWS